MFLIERMILALDSLNFLLISLNLVTCLSISESFYVVIISFRFV